MEETRLDAPGVLHHVMARGIEKRNIFLSDIDRQSALTSDVARYLGVTNSCVTRMISAGREQDKDDINLDL